MKRTAGAPCCAKCRFRIGAWVFRTRRSRNEARGLPGRQGEHHAVGGAERDRSPPRHAAATARCSALVSAAGGAAEADLRTCRAKCGERGRDHVRPHPVARPPAAEHRPAVRTRRSTWPSRAEDASGHRRVQRRDGHGSTKPRSSAGSLASTAPTGLSCRACHAGERPQQCRARSSPVARRAGSRQPAARPRSDARCHRGQVRASAARRARVHPAARAPIASRKRAARRGWRPSAHACRCLFHRAARGSGRRRRAWPRAA